MDLEIKKVDKPLICSNKKKNEYKSNDWNDIETIVLLANEKDTECFTAFIKQIVLTYLSNEKRIIFRFSEVNSSIMEDVEKVFSKSDTFRIFPAFRKKWLYYVPGTILSDLREYSCVNKLFEFWGTVDFIQILALKVVEDTRLHAVIEDDVYKISPKGLILLLPFVEFIITDTGDGNEAEFIVHKEFKDELINCIVQEARKENINLIGIL